MARTPGSLNKNTIPVAIRCQEMGADPVAVLVEYLSKPEFAMKAAEILMQYIYPKRKAIEFELKDIPDSVFDQEAERRVHLKILKGEIKASDVG